MEVLRRGLAVSPELRTGIAFTIGMAIATAVGRLVTPVLIQQILDKGVSGTDGFRPGFVRRRQRARPGHRGRGDGAQPGHLHPAGAGRPRGCSATCGSQAFAHIHRLSIADHNESRRGELTARVTSDVETIARFAQWGGVAWIVDTVIIIGTLARDGHLLVAAHARDDRGDGARCCRSCACSSAASCGPTTRCAPGSGQTLGAVSESVMGAGVIRAYGITGRVRDRVHAAIDRQYVAEKRTARYFAFMFPLGDIFGGARPRRWSSASARGGARAGACRPARSSPSPSS